MIMERGRVRVRRPPDRLVTILSVVDDALRLETCCGGGQNFLASDRGDPRPSIENKLAADCVC